VDLYIHFPIRLHGVVLNSLNTGQVYLICYLTVCVCVVLFLRRYGFHVITREVVLYVCHLKGKDVTPFTLYKKTMQEYEKDEGKE
jgi:hypothetical protein